MNEFLNGPHAQVNAETVTLFFLTLMLALLFVSVVLRIRNSKAEFVEQAPGLITSLGILGTFTGIVLGLVNFNIDQIDQSIATLMAGLRTAFVTSILGIAIAISFRVFSLLLPRFGEPKQELVTINDLHEASLAQSEQLSHLCAVLQENHQRQYEQFEKTVDNLATKAGASLSEQLNQIVERFNERVEEQFGGNLKALSSTLDSFFSQLTSYEQQLKRLTEFSVVQTQQLDHASQTLADANHSVAQIPTFLAELEPVLRQGSEQVSRLNEGFEKYSELTEKLQHLLPKMSINAEEFATGMTTIQKLLTEDIRVLLEGYKQVLGDAQQQTLAPVEKWQEQLHKSMLHFDGQLHHSIEGIRATSDQLNEHMQLVSHALQKMATVDHDMVNALIEESVQAHRGSMMDLAEHQAHTHSELTEALSKMIDQYSKRSDLILERQVELINQHLDREIEKVMGSMGEALATIGGQFTRDYQLLISQMKRAMESAGELH